MTERIFQMMTGTDILTVLLIVGIMILIILLLRKRSSTRNDHNDSSELLGQLNEKLTSQERLFTSLLDERLQRNSDNLQQTLERTASETSRTLGDLRDRLGQITVHQENISELSTNINQLHQVLASNQKQGKFGELRLEEIVTEVLPAQNYQFQCTLSNKRQVDLLLKLPNPPGPICVDSKFPVPTFQAIQTAREAADVASARSKFRTAVRKHIADIASKYIVAGETSEFALMFLPSEAIFVEIQSNHPELVRESQNARVYIVSPTTMMATVTAIRGIVRDAELSNQANQVRQALLKVAVDVENLDELGRKLGSHFDLLQGDVSKIIRGIQKLRDKINLIDETGHEAEPHQNQMRDSDEQL